MRDDPQHSITCLRHLVAPADVDWLHLAFGISRQMDHAEGVVMLGR